MATAHKLESDAEAPPAQQHAWRKEQERQEKI